MQKHHRRLISCSQASLHINTYHKLPTVASEEQDTTPKGTTDMCEVMLF